MLSNFNLMTENEQTLESSLEQFGKVITNKDGII
jgi:hypothetical protein